MTWRAFLLGLLLVTLLSWSDVHNGMARGWGKMTESNFPTACVFGLVVTTLVLNTLIKLVRKRAALRQAELMLVWCMLLMAATVASTGLQRFWFPMLAAPAYLAQRPEVVWRETALRAVPDTLVLTKDPKSIAARDFYEGGRTEGRLPWRQWLTPISRWGAFFAVYYGAVLFMCAILRKQWVDKERLQFPLASVPLEFSEGSAGETWLPPIFSNRAFVIGLMGALGFRFVRAVPLLFGGTSTWSVDIPLGTIFAGTPLEVLGFANTSIYWAYIGFAYLVPVDVSISIWFFYLFARAEVLAAFWMGSPLGSGGGWSPLITWQQAGAYVAFTAGVLFMCRRHFQDVVRKAFGGAREVDESREPIRLSVAFWGLLICSVLALAWLIGYRMRPLTAVAWFAVLMCVQLVHARLVCQSGVPNAWLTWDPANFLYSASGGHAFGAPGAVIAHMHRRMLHSVLHGPAMMHCMRISEVFTKHRRLLALIMVFVLGLSVAVSSRVYLRNAYTRGVLNFNTEWAATNNVKNAFNLAHQKIQRVDSSRGFSWLAFALGVAITSAVMAMRARFYWWPLHPIGLMTCSGYHPDWMWLPFLLGWLIKVSISRYAGGRALRHGRYFFIGVILAEACASGLAAVVRSTSAGTVPLF